MQKAAVPLAFLVLIGLSSAAQQPSAPAPVESKSIPVTPYRPAQSQNAEGQACPAKFENHPDIDGVYRLGMGIKPPRPVHQQEAEISDQARKAIRDQGLQDFHTVSVLSFVVDAEGKPQDICIERQADLGLDDQAVKALRQYRFDPATKEGTPVAVRITLEVNFRSYSK